MYVLKHIKRYIAISVQISNYFLIRTWVGMAGVHNNIARQLLCLLTRELTDVDFLGCDF